VIAVIYALMPLGLLLDWPGTWWQALMVYVAVLLLLQKRTVAK